MCAARCGGVRRVVRFTLSCRGTGSSTRMDFQNGDRISDVGRAAREVLGFKGFVLCNGYRLLNPDGTVGASISEGDTVTVIPDPEDDRTWPDWDRGRT